MLECIHRIEEYTESQQDHFMTSTLVQDAVVRNLQILSESSQRLSSAYKDEYADIPWRDISGFRNILVHDYLGLDVQVIWSVVAQDLPHLKNALLDMLGQTAQD